MDIRFLVALWLALFSQQPEGQQPKPQRAPIEMPRLEAKCQSVSPVLDFYCDPDPPECGECE